MNKMHPKTKMISSVLGTLIGFCASVSILYFLISQNLSFNTIINISACVISLGSALVAFRKHILVYECDLLKAKLSKDQ
jgi:hypothetical protein